MRQSQLFTKTTRDISKDEQAVNAQFLIRAGFIDKVMAGVYTFLPLGWRVIQKIEAIIREEMNNVGVELLMPALSPQELWETSGRLETIDILMKTMPANKPAAAKHDASYILNPTQEDVVTPLIKKFAVSYKDLPLAVYHIQTKFRNEPRAKSGLLRCREFRMKDLYSFHASLEDMQAFYEQMKERYVAVFDRLGLGDDTYITLASGGDFTKNYSHEFQTLCPTGEDTIHICSGCQLAINDEIKAATPACLACGGKDFRVEHAAEVGNIFPLETKFSKAFDYTYTDEQGKRQPVFMASYGIGSSRVMGVLVEKFHDDKGMIWPAAVAPFAIHLVALGKTEAVFGRADDLYRQLSDRGIEVLYDDRRDATAGVKFSDSDLMGLPVRLVISDKTGEQVEYKRRDQSSSELLSVPEAIDRLTA